MNEQLKQYLSSINVRVVNPIYSEIHKRSDEDIIGWHCKATSYLRMDSQITRAKEFCRREGLFYNFVEPNDTTLFFYIYK